MFHLPDSSNVHPPKNQYCVKNSPIFGAFFFIGKDIFYRLDKDRALGMQSIDMNTSWREPCRVSWMRFVLLHLPNQIHRSQCLHLTEGC